MLYKDFQPSEKELPYFLSVIDVANQLPPLTRLRRHPVRLMKEGQSLHHSTQSLIVCNAKTLVLNVSIIPLEASVRPFLQRWLNDWNVFISVPAPSRYVIRYVERELKEKEDTIEANKEQLKLVEEEWEHLNLYPTK